MNIPFPRVLMGPGPSIVAPTVLEVLGRPPVGHLDPFLFEALAELQAGLRLAYGTKNDFTIALTGTGMAGMESCFANLVEPGDTVLVGIHGFFGLRMAELAERYGARVIRVEVPWGQPLDLDALAESGRQAGNVKIVACVHAETSTGVRQPLGPVSEIAKSLGALFVADTVTSLGGLPVELDYHGVDAAYSGTQKCLGCPVGLSPISVSERAWKAVESRTTPVSNWYYDWRLLQGYWSETRAYHHTVPGNLLLALREGVRLIVEEGLEARFARHKAASDLLMDGLLEQGFQPFAAEGFRLPSLNTVVIPQDVDDVAVRGRLLRDYGIEIGGGLGPLKGKIWRIGTMGESARARNVELLLGALRRIRG